MAFIQGGTTVMVASDAVGWAPSGSSAADTFLKRLAGGTLVVQDFGGSNANLQLFNLTLSGTIVNVGGVATAGKGTPIIVGYGRTVGAVAAVPSVAAYTVGAADGTFEVSGNILATVSTTYSFNLNVTYFDESNTSRTIPLNMMLTSGALTNSAALANTNGPLFDGIPMHIRAKAGTAITIATAGTFTTVTYNVEGLIKQTA